MYMIGVLENNDNREKENIIVYYSISVVLLIQSNHINTDTKIGIKEPIVHNYKSVYIVEVGLRVRSIKFAICKTWRILFLVEWCW